MKYLLLIYSNPESRAIWNGFSDEQRADGWHRHFSLVEDLAEAGELILAEGLADPSTSKRVSVVNRQAVASDGPFAEVKEYIAGFILIECDSPERALEWAARIPEAQLGLVEIRPVLDRTGVEM